MTLTNGFESSSDGGAVHVNFADLNLDYVTVSDSSTEGASAGGVSVRNGNLSLTSSTVTRNSTERDVGGLWVRDGNLDLINSTISDNSARTGGGAALTSASTGGSLYMIDSTVSGNSASGAAGGLFVSTGEGQTTSIFDSTFSNNTAMGGNGGGLYIRSPDVEMTNVVVTANSTTNSNRGGGGLFLGPGNMTLTNMTVSGNQAGRAGGGLSISSTNLTLNDSRIIDNFVVGDFGGGAVSGGGGLMLYVGEVTINNTTISGNSTDLGSRGGGIATAFTNLALHNSTVSGNSSTGNAEGGGIHLSDDSDAALIHSTVADNTAVSGADGIHIAPPSQFSLDNSLIVQSGAGETACSTQASSHSNTLATDSSCTGTGTALADIALQPLADNGGPTLTHALGPNSVAIEAAGDCVSDFGIDTDQRGFQRPGFDSSSCDIGAFEFQNLFTVSGTVSGLAGSGLVLQNNGEDDLAIDSDGSFTFASSLTSGSNYNVEVLDYPVKPLQSCSLANATGTIDGADVNDVAVECETGFTVGGSVTGLALPGLVLDLNGGSMLLFDVDNDYAFPRPLPDGAEYQVTVELAPNAHDCQTANATGTIAGADVVDADVACTTDILFADGLETLQPDPVALD